MGQSSDRIYCRVNKGVMSELSSLRQLSKEEVDEYRLDPRAAERICPGGTILSSDSPDFMRLQQPERSIMPDLDSIQIHKRGDAKSS